MRKKQRVLGRYDVVGPIGDGGQGYVAKAIDRKSKQTVAIKQLAAEADEPLFAEYLARFEREAHVRIGQGKGQAAAVFHHRASREHPGPHQRH
jgi:serine/threonine protein kinase